MPRYKTIYEKNAKEYDLLVSREDYQGNILKEVSSICSLVNCHVVEFGAGTGRLTTLLSPFVKNIKAFDAYPAMIEVGRSNIEALGILNVSFAVAENKNLPLENSSADLSIAGWTFGHCTSWFPDSWRLEISAAIEEMKRVTKPGGSLIILETLGTGEEDPKAPNQSLADYYALIESEFGFKRSWIRTDYCFDSQSEAKHLTTTFFGREYQFRGQENGQVILPECTGIWNRIN